MMLGNVNVYHSGGTTVFEVGGVMLRIKGVAAIVKQWPVNPVMAIKTIRDLSGVSLADAKNIVDYTSSCIEMSKDL